MRKFLCGFFGFFCSCAVAQQQPELSVDPTDTPYRPRVAEFTVNTLYDYNTSSTSDELGAGQSEVERDHKIKARLGIPIMMKSDLLLCMQLKYDRQRFIIENENNVPYELYEHLQDTRFTSLGGKIFLQRKFDGNKEITGLIGMEISSDKIEFNKNTTNSYVNVNYLVDKNDRVTYGTGLAFTYSLGRSQVYPLVFYENKLSHKWTMDLKLPKSAVMRYRFNAKTYLSFKTELKGWRYAVHNDQLSESTLTLRKSDVQTGFEFERELHDWLWIGLEAGVTKNINHYLVESGGRRNEAIADLSPNEAPFTNFSIFIVPPRKFYR